MLATRPRELYSSVERQIFFADTLPYPLLVLLVTSGMSTAIPPLFYVDLVATPLHSTLKKHAYVKLGRFKRKSRHWWVGTANVGESKSVAMKDLVGDLIATLARNTAFAVGTSSDRFLCQQSGTTAGAVDKLRTCEGFFTVYCPGAGRCLSADAAKGGKVDVHKHIYIEFFLDAAHGAEFNHSAELDRQRVLQKPRKNPREAVASIPPLHIDPTNITLALMQQDLYFQEWWAQIARAHPVGIPQRCLLSFGGDMDPVTRAWNEFFNDIARPIISDLFDQVVRHVGPRVTSPTPPIFRISSQQEDVFADIEIILKLFQRRSELSQLYSLGTACLTNLLVSQFWLPALRKQSETCPLAEYVDDGTFLAAIQFVHRRYLAGQAVLAVTSVEEAWITRNIPYHPDAHDLTSLLVRNLRGPADHTLF